MWSLTSPLSLLVFGSIVNATTVNRLRARASIPSQQSFDSESTMFRSQGQCRVYTANPTKGKASTMDLCSNVCGGDLYARAAKSSLDCVSVSCMGRGGLPSDNPSVPDPQNDLFVMGYCKCSFPVIEFMASEFAGVVLPKIATVACATFQTAIEGVLKEALEIGANFIPVIGPEASVGLRLAIQSAKTLTKYGGDAIDFVNYVSTPCGLGGQDVVNDINNAFDFLAKVKDAAGVAEALACPPKKSCGKKPKMA
ncbi:hypothetical protein GLAREA_12956 [Glarea lozoyensis ATCC 20868]|uniref:Uncharacterized protein n=1 Tax=Glarea lozoyensis (strain ATCC 20868 / MF5171) TaxID=1116229 RepID=S3DV07_GLAL2|nr:uncharacterized protein GLAREA_12956 [Glarea lozoyensis ATCC 20868]EPE30233.1 hypothetical protein GLAREA_12956 [Glarea lozoyensis ATCC 20868]